MGVVSHYLYSDVTHKDVLWMISNDMIDAYWLHIHNSFAYNQDFANPKFTHCLSIGEKATPQATNKVTLTTTALTIIFKRWEL